MRKLKLQHITRYKRAIFKKVQLVTISDSSQYT